MMVRSILLLAGLAAAGCNSAKNETPATPPKAVAPKAVTPKAVTPKAVTPKAVTPKAVTPKAVAPKASTLAVGVEGPLPASDRIFVARLDGVVDHVLGANGSGFWAARPTTPGRGVLIWQRQGLGVVQRVALGDTGKGLRLFVARGVGRGHLKAPLSLAALDPLTGQGKQLWVNRGARNECAHLSVTDVDGDGTQDLAFAYYDTKYTVKTRHLKTGKQVETPAIRMANVRDFGDLNGDKQPDEAIGRLYGDAKGVPGDLKVQFGAKTVVVPTENGVRALIQLEGALLFADGWVANYGKLAKAQLKRATFDKALKPTITQVGTSPDEFTFFDLTAVDFDGDGRLDLLARGNKHLSLFQSGADPKQPWTMRHLAPLTPVLNTAVGQDPKQAKKWLLYVPGRPSTAVVPLK